MTYTITSGQLTATVEADSPIEAAKIALHECGTVELGFGIEVDSQFSMGWYPTELIIALLGQTII